MPRLIQCKKLGRELPGLTFKPFPNELGQRIYDDISQDAWKLWLEHFKMVLNEYRLAPGRSAHLPRSSTSRPSSSSSARGPAAAGLPAAARQGLAAGPHARRRRDPAGLDLRAGPRAARPGPSGGLPGAGRVPAQLSRPLGRAASIRRPGGRGPPRGRLGADAHRAAAGGRGGPARPATAPAARLAFHGLYAPLHADLLAGAGAVAVLGGECEPELVALAEALERGETDLSRFVHRGPAGVPIRRLDYPVAEPRRATLPFALRPARPR